MADTPDPEWEEHERKRDLWLIREVGIKASMLETLRSKDDDWTFIIKIHALIEVALNHMVSGMSPMHRDELFPIIERLPIQGRAGKIEFASSISALPKESKIYCLNFFRSKTPGAQH